MTRERIQHLLDRFSQQKILVIGDAVLDHYVYGAVERLNPEAPVPLLHVERENHMSGAAGNTAKNTAALGAATVLVSVVGQDTIAMQLEEAATRNGFTTRFIHDADRQTIRKVRFMAGTQQLLRVDYEQITPLSLDLEQALMQCIEEEITEGVTGVIISDYAKGGVNERVVKETIRLARARSIPVAADVKPPLARFITGARLISPNLKEARQFVQAWGVDGKVLPPDKLADLLHRNLKTDVFITLGAQGMQVKTDTYQGHIPQAHVVAVFDVSGAGDTAIAVLLLAHLAGAKPEEAAQLANAAGAVVVEKVGSATASIEEIKGMILHHHQ